METTQTPILLDRNQERIDQEKNKIESDLNILNNIIESFEALEIGELNSMDMFRSILNYPKATTEKMIMDSLPDVGEYAEKTGIKTTKVKMLHMAIPDNLPAFISKVESLRGVINGINWDLFDFVIDRIKVKSNVYSLIEDKYSVYIDTPEREQFYNTVMDFKSAFLNIQNSIKEFNKDRDPKDKEMYIFIEPTGGLAHTYIKDFKEFNKKAGDFGINHKKLVSMIRQIK
jgi:hypothetical protein